VYKVAIIRKSAEQRLRVAIDGLPPRKLKQLADYAEYLKSREEWEATLELLNDPSTRKDIEEGQAQASRNEGRKWREIKQHVRS
jgi:hypothetical protein